MGNQMIVQQLREANLDPDSNYAKRWNEESTKDYLIQKIKTANLEKMRENPGFYPKRTTEAKLIKEHFRNFHGLDQKDHMLLVLNHPNLEREDFEKILKLSGEALEYSLYTTLGCSVATYLIYKNFFQTKSRFYNFFRKPNQWRITKAAKTVGAGLTIFYSWFALCNYCYKIRMGSQITDLGLYDKYLLTFQDKYMYD